MSRESYLTYNFKHSFIDEIRMMRSVTPRGSSPSRPGRRRLRGLPGAQAKVASISTVRVFSGEIPPLTPETSLSVHPT